MTRLIKHNICGFTTKIKEADCSRCDDIRRELDRFDNPTTPDEKNPKFMFQGTDKDLLIKAIKGEIDLQHLAKQELANRGLSVSGTRVGFNAAKMNVNLFWDVFLKKFISIPSD